MAPLLGLGLLRGSFLATLLFGVAVGNAIVGMPLDARGNFPATVLDQLNPYPLLVGLLTVALFAMHGAIFLYLKTEGELQERLRDWMWHTWGIFLVTSMLTTIYTVARGAARHGELRALSRGLVGVVVVTILAVANIPRCLYWDRPGQAFLSSTVVIVSRLRCSALRSFPTS